jgi:hypothetical protein
MENAVTDIALAREHAGQPLMKRKFSEPSFELNFIIIFFISVHSGHFATCSSQWSANKPLGTILGNIHYSQISASPACQFLHVCED